MSYKLLKLIVTSFICVLTSILTSEATPITFRYESSTDARGAGGSSMASVNLTFSFDSNLPNGTGNFGISPRHGSYGPWHGTLQVGSEEITLAGGTLFLWNDITVVYSDGTSKTSDGYDFRWSRHFADSRFGGSSSGTLLGRQLEFFRILIVDMDHDMLSSNALPLDPVFATKGDYIQDNYELSSGGDVGPNIFFGLSESSGPGRAYTLTTVPEPSAAAFFSIGAATLVSAFLKRRRTLC